MPRKSVTAKPLRALALVSALAFGTPFLTAFPAQAQGVPVVDTQNITQNIQQLRQMIEDEILQNEQLVQLREQLATLTDQLAELQRTYEALTRLAELPEIIRTQMEDELNGLLDQEFGDIIATIEAIKTGDFSGLAGSGSSEIETQMDELKESVDLNTRVTAELAIALVAMWQLEAVQTVADGTGGVIDAATIAEEQRFMEFTLPELNAD